MNMLFSTMQLCNFTQTTTQWDTYNCLKHQNLSAYYVIRITLDKICNSIESSYLKMRFSKKLKHKGKD